ncbi:MAG: hypothetical protein M3Y28_03865 [Armatimonadota bacterium]|nr:hypothetical protein [Armatimonadota bacterium]
MEDSTPIVDSDRLVRYIRAALDMDGVSIGSELIERVLELEMEFLQHQGIAEQAVNDPRPER